MMLTALNANTGDIIDITTLAAPQIDDLNGKRVAQRHGYDVICKGCHRPSHLVKNHHHTVFFRHNPGTGNCILNELSRGSSESEEHLQAKAALAQAFRSLGGWDAQLEQLHNLDGDVVEIDVATRYLNTPTHDAQGAYAWEVQLSPQTAGEFTLRSNEIRRISGHRVTWLTPHATPVGRNAAMICDPKAQLIVARLLTSTDPWITTPPTPVDKIVKSVHRARPGHHHHEMLDQYGEERTYHIVDIADWRTGTTPDTRRTHSGGAHNEPADTRCQRPLEAPAARPAAPSTPATLALNTCDECGKGVVNPWGFGSDPPRCKECFIARPHLYFNKTAS